MKNLALFLVIFLPLLACVSGEQKFDNYGGGISVSEALSTEEFIASVSTSEAEYKVKGRVEEVCQMKGCWMTLQNEKGANVRVKFKDYAFFVPKDIHGKEVVIEGVAVRELLDEDEARHYAEDGNQQYEESMRNSISFVASGVLVAKD